MNIPGYDAWKLAGPDDDAKICPHCGAYSNASCENQELDFDPAAPCPWLEEIERSEPDPDYLRDLRMDDDERQTINPTTYRGKWE